MGKEQRIDDIAKATHKSFPYFEEQWDELQEDAKEPYRNFAHQINALLPQGDSEGLLTPEEQRPFVKARIVGYGDIEVTEEHWDIDGLLKAQRDLTLSLLPKGDEEGLVDINAILEELGKEDKPRTIMDDFIEIRNRQRDLTASIYQQKIAEMCKGCKYGKH